MTEGSSFSRPGNGWFANTIIAVALLFLCLVLREIYVGYDVSVKYEHARAQCMKYGGIKGEIPVVTDGVYDLRSVPVPQSIFGRASLYINNGLEYVEFPSAVVRLDSSYFESNGPHFKGHRSRKYAYYRAFVTSRDNILCQPYEDMIRVRPSYFSDERVTKDQCVAVVGFDESTGLKATYEFVINQVTVEEGTAIEWDNLEIVDRKSRLVLASYRTFSHCFTKILKHPDGFNYCSGGSDNPQKNPTCPKNYMDSADELNAFERSAFTYERVK